jgi:muramidase (phage lysozyme)
MNNLAAFLKMIQHSEGTDKAPNPYAVTFGYKFTITDFSDHPAVLGTWHGEPLATQRPDGTWTGLGPDYAGLVSTAAGAYQIIKPTWLALKARLNLPDFCANSQDAAATSFIREKGVLDMVNGGQVADAIELCHGIWASLPGSPSGQPQAKIADLIQAYTENGGGFA